MDLAIKGKKALVLGGSSGIGYGIASALVSEEASVCLAARDIDRLHSAREEMGADSVVSVDLREQEAGTNLIEVVQQEFGSPDILVINTGGPPKGTFAAISDAAWEEQYQNLFLSTVQVIRAALPAMEEKKWGRCLVVTSVAAREPIPGLTVSNALRAGVLGLVNSVSRECAPHGITVNSILPGYTQTERLQDLGSKLDQLVAAVPAGRTGTPEEAGKLAAFLCSEHAGYITGQAVCIDGGLTWSM